MYRYPKAADSAKQEVERRKSDVTQAQDNLKRAVLRLRAALRRDRWHETTGQFAQPVVSQRVIALEHGSVLPDFWPDDMTGA